MVRIALDTFAARDVEQARSLVELDELIDRNEPTRRRQVLQTLTRPRHGMGMRMIVASRCLERIGDNAVNIGEQTEFVVTGDFREFTDASH